MLPHMPLNQKQLCMLGARNMLHLVLLIVLLLGHHSGSQKTGGASEEGRGTVKFLQWADHYDFALQLTGSESQCYWHYARKDGRFYLTYMVQFVTGMIGDRRIAVSILSPKGVLISLADDSTSQMSVKATEPGFYQMCFANYHNRFGNVRVFLNFGVYYEGMGEEQEEFEVEEGLLNTTLSNMQDISNKIRIRIQHMWRFYNVARMRRGADYYLLLAKSNYVNTWSILQSFLIIMAGCMQLFVLKRFFRTEGDRPRC